MEVGTKLNMWSKADTYALTKLLREDKHMPVSEMCILLGRKDQSIRTKIRTLGYRKFGLNGWERVTKSSRRYKIYKNTEDN